ncbi:MAG: hypothetical protein R2911_26220 [Caldilineaceae bacterium]
MRKNSWLGLILLAIVTFLIFHHMPTRAQAGANCSAAYFIDATLPSGARWQMCWEHRNREGIVFYDVYYTSPDGTQRKVLAQAGLAQVHVPYDDNSSRYHDVSDYGLGGAYLDDLDASDCADGVLLRHNGKNVLCQSVQKRGYLYKYRNAHQPSYALTLFSVSHVGEYNYIPQWVFADDGAIEPSMGATGRLQRVGENRQYGWDLGDGRIGIAHTHNYYWRLDFDLGEDANDDVVEEFEFGPAGAVTRTLSQTTLDVEAGRPVAPELMRSWRVRDGSITNADGHPISYHLEPFEVGHRFIGPATEPWTANNFYVTKYNSCEKYASHNPELDGCTGDLSTFVNGESLVGADIVLWYGVSFHHLPRDEDEPYMHLHSSGFQLIQRDWMAESALALLASAASPTNIPTAAPTDTSTPVPATATATSLPTVANTPTLQPTATNTSTPVTTATPTPQPTLIDTPTPPPTAAESSGADADRGNLSNGRFGRTLYFPQVWR